MQETTTHISSDKSLMKSVGVDVVKAKTDIFRAYAVDTVVFFTQHQVLSEAVAIDLIGCYLGFGWWWIMDWTVKVWKAGYVCFFSRSEFKQFSTNSKTVTIHNVHAAQVLPWIDKAIKALHDVQALPDAKVIGSWASTKRLSHLDAYQPLHALLAAMCDVGAILGNIKTKNEDADTCAGKLHQAIHEEFVAKLQHFKDLPYIVL